MLSGGRLLPEFDMVAPRAFGSVLGNKERLLGLENTALGTARICSPTSSALPPLPKQSAFSGSQVLLLIPKG